jgi:hypothetical protein
MEFVLLQRRPRQRHVPAMDGIEGSAKESDVHSLEVLRSGPA